MLDIARLSVSTTGSDVAAGLHNHVASEIASEVFDVARLPMWAPFPSEQPPQTSAG
ncbi:MAG: hypothetical protein JRI25_17515 [Deltaproteobacteria bacterium]|nr:hypothetical protein [Deltaproteobacteria bacterium]